VIRCTLIVGFLLLAIAPAQDSESARKLDAARRLQEAKSFAAALQAYDAALPSVRASHDRPLLAHALMEAGQAALSSGRYARATEWADESATLFHDLNDPANEAQADNVSASSALYRGEYALALRMFERALDLARRQHDGRGEITRLSNIASIYFFQGRYLDALDIYDQALRRVDETAGAPWNPSRRQLVLANLAILYEQLGQNEKALDYYRQAAAAGTALPPAEQAQLLSSMGTLYRRLGDPVKALEIYGRAQKLFASEHLSDGEIHVLQNVGIAQALDFHDLPRALAAFTDARKLAESTQNRRETVLAHLFRAEALYRMSRFPDARADFAEALTGARAIGAREEEWTALYGRGRLERQAGDTTAALATFREAIGVIELVRSDMGNSSLKSDFLANKREVYDGAIELLLRDPAPDAAQFFDLVEKARSRNLQDRLRNTSEPLTLAAVQRRLAPGTTLIEYWTANGQVAALWIAPHATGIVTRPFPDELAANVRAFAGDAPWRPAADTLGRALLSSIPRGREAAALVIVPDGPLYAVPFEALAEGPGAPLLIEQASVSYLPSAALLLRTPTRSSPAFPWRPELAAFGDPTVDASGALPGDERWSRLPASARELDSIAHIVPGGAKIFSGANDLKRHVFALGDAAPPLLHFSTHAAADTTDPNRSRILFTREDGRRGSEYLFRAEVQSLPLQRVDLVTLSACDTEGGKVARGEGVQSFSRAFLAAGARSTVTTLWRVADQPTADFMEIFYRRLAGGEGKAQALRAAKLDFLRSGNERTQPKYWAAFVLNGDGQSAIPAVYSWLWIVGPAIALAAVLLIYRRARGPALAAPKAKPV
jgi:tetratricopeptide (TPR) repeat protein